MSIEQEVIEGNKLIAVFYNTSELVDEIIRDGKVWCHTPVKKMKSWIAFEDLKYHTSWDWQVPVWGKIALAVKTLVPKLSEPEESAKWYFKLLGKYEQAVFQNKPQHGQKIIVELIEWYNKEHW